MKVQSQEQEIQIASLKLSNLKLKIELKANQEKTALLEQSSRKVRRIE